MPVAASTLAAALRERLDGEVWAGAPARSLYATAACIYRVEPALVVWPRHADDIAEVVRIASAEGVPVTARGAGSGVAGQPLTTGIVLDLQRHMNRIRDVGADAVEVEPGVILDDLKRELGRHGRTFGPDPSSGAFCTLGGMFATNASGAHAPRDGTTRDWVLGMEAVLPSGASLDSCRPELLADVRRIAEEGRTALQRERPRVRKSSSGYDLWGILDGPPEAVLDRFLCGSEGTLAITTKLRLRTSPLASSEGSALLAFESARQACAEGLPLLAPFAVTAAELLDETVIALLVDRVPAAASRLPDGTGAVLLVDLEGESPRDVRARLAALEQGLKRPAGPALAVSIAGDGEERQALWAVRRAVSPHVKSLGSGGRRPLRFVEDGAVPVDALAEYLERLRALLASRGLTAPVFGHAASGHLHCNPALDPRRDGDLALLEETAHAHAALVRSLGGTLTGEHGDGRLRAPLLPGAFPEVFPLFRAVKRLFDPEGILNPGVIVPLAGARVTDGIERPRGAKARPDGEEGWKLFLSHRARLEESGGEIA